MTWILSATGVEVDVRIPRVGHIRLADIAHALSQINRFNGHASRPYSVAEHSLLVADIVRDVLKGKAEAQLCALMHDAHEAYCGDMATPLKDEIGADWRYAEARWANVTRTAFDLQDCWYRHAGIVKQADLIALATERRDLMPASGAPWECLADVWVMPQRLPHSAAPWTYWRDSFIRRFNDLEAEVGRTRTTTP
jgi:hypothetical protein